MVERAAAGVPAAAVAGAESKVETLLHSSLHCKAGPGIFL